MSLTENFYVWLGQQSSITSLLGSPDAIYPNRIPQGLRDTVPAITYRKENDQDVALLDGGISTLRFGEIEVWCWADSSPEAEAIAEALRAALAGFSGSMGAIVVDPVRKTFDDSDLEVDTGLYYNRQAYTIPYR